ncbi:MAG: phosphate ABC transporter permease [Gammaproteobacteria bacterium]
MTKNRLFGAVMAVGGVSVIIAILLIFFYLFWVVIPLFTSPHVESSKSYQLSHQGAETPVLYSALEEYAEIALLVHDTGEYAFIDASTGAPVVEDKLTPNTRTDLVAFGKGDPATRAIFAAFADGRISVAKPEYALSYPNDKRQITPSMTYPLGTAALELDHDLGEIVLIAGQYSSEETTIAIYDSNGKLTLVSISVEESLLDDEVTAEVSFTDIPLYESRVKHLRLDIDQRELFVVTDNDELLYFDVQNKSKPSLVDRVAPDIGGHTVTALEFLAGGISLLVGDSGGTITQWFPVRDANNNYSLQSVRSFNATGSPITAIEPEYFRKGFAAADASGNVSFYHTTAERELMSFRADDEPLTVLAIGPRANALFLVQQNNNAALSAVQNEHPEVSFKSIWQPVWYESRDKPEFIWQSSSASSDFEPKFSLTPLTFGTIKAAFYAMVFAMPLAILGAVYTAYFMTPKMRSFVKPSVEIMAALPTVILGFLAGLWLAPLIERYLPGVFIATICVPLSFIAASAIFHILPERFRYRIAEGWEAALLIPLVCFGVWFSFLISPAVETAFFGGNMPAWISENLGLAYDQRNSLVVGMAIGFAVIPTIFSISEDAVFGVPKHLTTGSLALGATPWQTVIGVVLLTASPGIFSAVMIGLGRAVGETMIVLMATGNTPIMDLNIFQGFRALSANIAVEMPESEVDSTHYRILFLAALVLFAVTFAFNTVAEVVRQRLREKYSNL